MSARFQRTSIHSVSFAVVPAMFTEVNTFQVPNVSAGSGEEGNASFAVARPDSFVLLTRMDIPPSGLMTSKATSLFTSGHPPYVTFA